MPSLPRYTSRVMTSPSIHHYDIRFLNSSHRTSYCSSYTLWQPDPGPHIVPPGLLVLRHRPLLLLLARRVSALALRSSGSLFGMDKTLHQVRIIVVADSRILCNCCAAMCR